MFGKFNNRRRIGLLLLLAALLVVTLTPGLASAHGRRDVSNSKYQFVVGFLGEPAFSGQQNGIDLTVCQGACVTNTDGTLKNPVKDVDKTLKAEVIYGSQTLPVTLTPRYKADGKYNGVFFPSKAGEYTFHFSGTIGSDPIDEKFVSSKDGFNSVEDTAPLQFPATQSSAALDQQLKDAKDSASTATIIAIIGIVVGVIGLAVGGFALLRRPAVPATSVVDRDLVGSNRG